ncbi:YggS family pyridoxal phosphate-dependent enzyme [Ichthyobacterium seriolicida]|uniref:Pyridoxal phosphate homeostasis protein n=1 Tax=Ichthyobacterium seriolicida TaxID=242600 RepID=A0A1J1DZ94_9FLAO|nr:YggS family pyridoxal phosphate-dependent enzyme [Ichthyobacterium seriolicida]BAV95239.1 alanine racemase [Ichthyobacterium seriolicida]
MLDIARNLYDIINSVPDYVKLVVVSKKRSIRDIEEVYNAKHRDFGENRVRDLCDKYQELPKDIRWHMIGHLQVNKVKYIAPFVELIHSVDSLKLLKEINKRAIQNNRKINCLLQLNISKEVDKYGFSESDLKDFFFSEDIGQLSNVNILGLMGMATNTKDIEQISKEFVSLNSLFQTFKKDFGLKIISMGMSNDYSIAIENGSNMIRVGRSIFES